VTVCLDILQGLRLATDIKYVTQYSCGLQYQIWSNSIEPKGMTRPSYCVFILPTTCTEHNTLNSSSLCRADAHPPPRPIVI